MFGAALGTSTTGAYIESAAGVQEGARTALANVITAFLVVVMMPFTWSVADGIAAGFIAYPILELASGGRGP